MFNLDKALEDWRRQMAAGRISTAEVLKELESHLREDVRQQMRSGVNAEQAFEAAVQRIGRANALKAEFQKVGRMRWALLRRFKRFVARCIGVPFPPLTSFNASERQTLEFARAEAPRFHHDFIGTEHVLLGLLEVENGAVRNVLRRFGVDREAIRLEIEKFVGLGPVREAATAIPYTPRARKSLLLAAREAQALNHAYVGAEHIFLGLLLEGDGVAARVLRNLGIQIEKTREEILKEIGPESE
jgi:hypothetical protein